MLRIVWVSLLDAKLSLSFVVWYKKLYHFSHNNNNGNYRHNNEHTPFGTYSSHIFNNYRNIAIYIYNFVEFSPGNCRRKREGGRDTVRNTRLYGQYVGILVTRLRRKSTSQRFNCIICQALKMQTVKKRLFIASARESQKQCQEIFPAAKTIKIDFHNSATTGKCVERFFRIFFEFFFRRLSVTDFSLACNEAIKPTRTSKTVNRFGCGHSSKEVCDGGEEDGGREETKLAKAACETQFNGHCAAATTPSSHRK